MAVLKEYFVPVYTRPGLTSFIFGRIPVELPDTLKITREIPVVMFESMHQVRDCVFTFVDEALRLAMRARTANITV